jgi:hypothetical protein
MLKLKEPVGMVEGRGYAREIDRLDAGEIQAVRISDAQGLENCRDRLVAVETQWTSALRP